MSAASEVGDEIRLCHVIFGDYYMRSASHNVGLDKIILNLESQPWGLDLIIL